MFPLNPAAPISRRELLRHIGGGFGALGLASVLATDARAAAPADASPLAPKPTHFPARAKRVIFLFMNGGPSHIDTFDPKPELDKQHGKDPPTAINKRNTKLMKSPFKFQKYGESGIDVSELYPEVGQRCIDDICVIRSMYHETPAHERALLLMNSGNVQPIRPCWGSWLTYGLGTENQNLPGFVVLCPGKPVVGPQLWSNSFLPAVYQGTHINNKTVNPKQIIRYVENRLPPEEQRRQLDLLRAMNELHLTDRGPDSQLEARIQSLELAYRMQFEAMDVFDLGREPAAVRDRYGKGEFADACLIARRLAERGVRVTQVYYGNDQPWDDHKDINLHRNHAQKSDRPIAALLEDLKARGLLDETLVIWGGEFGRTPTSEGDKGRDHHSRGFTMWLAGGGVKGGLMYGTTDELGIDAVENRVHVHDLHATVLYLMGIDHEKLTFRYSGRDFRLTDVHGQVVKGILRI
jgi:hypothetical protein